jgi:uncharacterized sulfatase
LDAPDLPWKDAVYSVVARAEDRTQNVEHTEFLGRAVRTKGWRYVEWDDGRRGIELYDRQSDPQEFNNLAQDPAHSDTVRKLHALLMANRSTLAEPNQ